MKNKRRNHSAQFKVKVALECCKRAEDNCGIVKGVSGASDPDCTVEEAAHRFVARNILCPTKERTAGAKSCSLTSCISKLVN